ncbi:MAG: lysine exporter LysO family protein [Ignisphaera sp.]|nr:lysine exporter LysO family protein [Ignisphaera sp.]MCX8167718.1 lysine exporter LysO family protein [Ignisphaera sp.]MDW8085282.1 lysine exporter LysO family protein [Ignisphaera sp.]
MMERFSVIIVFVIGIGVGIVLYSNGIAVDMVTSKLIEPLLYAFIATVAAAIVFEIRSTKEIVSNIGLSLRLTVSTAVGSMVGGILTALILHRDLVGCLAIALGMGWYTFTGSYLAAFDSYLGLQGFTANMLREVATIVVYPVLSKRCPIESISIGGATTMDTTMPIIAKFTNARVALVAFIHGLILTLIIPVIIPALYN